MENLEKIKLKNGESCTNGSPSGICIDLSRCKNRSYDDRSKPSDQNLGGYLKSQPIT
jgi:hypothetical protein